MKTDRLHVIRSTPIIWSVLALVFLLAFNLRFTPGFYDISIREGRLYGSMIDILNRGAPVLLVSLGMTLVIATGGIDLSVGAVMAIAGAVAARMIDAEYSIVIVIGGSLAISALLGMWNGILVAFLRIQPIVATLILMVAGRGIAQLLTEGQILTFADPAFDVVGRGYLLAIPVPVILAIVCYVGAGLFLRRTAAGMFIESVGTNETASRFAGVNVRMTKAFAYTMCGLTAGLAGLIVASDIRGADANNAGLYIELDAILAVVVGGTALTGGRFFLLGSMIGALIIQTLTTTILTLGVPVQFNLVVKACTVLAVCLLQSSAFRHALRLGKRGAT